MSPIFALAQLGEQSIYPSPLDCEGKTFTGAYLMQNGIDLPFKHNVDYHKQNDWASRVIWLKAKE
ncbi:MAG: GH36 C-terminal domain-containing protein [Bacteroidaceae bacterium]|nr:GH36 C-terminal domain-containing protein [Bacteroidaceae bacterium]